MKPFIILLSITLLRAGTAMSGQEPPASVIDGLAQDHFDVRVRAVTAASRMPAGAIDTATIHALALELSQLTETVIARQDHPSGNCRPCIALLRPPTLASSRPLKEEN